MNIRSFVTRALAVTAAPQAPAAPEAEASAIDTMAAAIASKIAPAPPEVSAIDSMASGIFSKITELPIGTDLPAPAVPAAPSVTIATVPYVPKQVSCPPEETLPCATFGATETPSFSLKKTGEGTVVTLVAPPTATGAPAWVKTLDFETPVYSTEATLVLPKGPQPSTYTREGNACQSFVAKQVPYIYDTRFGTYIANGSDPSKDVLASDMVDVDQFMATLPRGVAIRPEPEYADTTCTGLAQNLTFAAATDEVFMAPPLVTPAPTEPPSVGGTPTFLPPRPIGPVVPTIAPPAPGATSPAAPSSGHHLSNAARIGIAVGISVACAAGVAAAALFLIPKLRSRAAARSSQAAARNPHSLAIAHAVRNYFGFASEGPRNAAGGFELPELPRNAVRGSAV